MNKQWIELIIKCDRDLEDLVCNYIYTLPITALEIEDSKVIDNNYKNTPDWVIMDSSMCYKSDKIIIKTYLENNENINENIKKLENTLKKIADKDKLFLDFSYDRLIEDEDWSKERKKHYDTIKVGDKIVVNPLWKEYCANNNEVVIDIDPGMAFGTGTHETTNLSLLALQQIELKNKVVYDIGTGSGILSIAAAKLGAQKVLAVDIDELCIEATNKNIILNKVDNKIETIHGDLADKISKETKADIVIANILYHIIVELIPNLNNLLKKDGIFIASGIINNKKEDLIKNLKSNNFEIIEILEKNDWVTFIVRNNNA